MGDLVVQPGTYANIAIRLDNTRMQLGHHVYEVLIVSQDHTESPLIATVEYDYRPDLRLSCSDVRIEDVFRSQPDTVETPVERHVWLFVAPEHNVSRAMCRSTWAGLRVSCREVPPPQSHVGQVFEVDLSIAPGTTICQRDETVFIDVESHCQQETIRLPVRVNVMSGTVAKPPIVVLRGLSSREHFVREVHVSSQAPLKVKSLKTSSSGIIASVEKDSGNSNGIVLRIEGVVPSDPLPNSLPYAVFEEAVTIEFDQPVGERSVVQLYGVMSP